MDKQLDEYLQHIRLIHISLLIVSATIAYLVISTWSAANELVIDLNNFTQMIEKAAQSDKEPQKLAEILPDWNEATDKPVKASIENQLGKPVYFHVPPNALRILSVTPGPLPSQFNSLEESRNELERRRWTIEVPDHIQSDLSDVRDWIGAVLARGDLATFISGITPIIRMDIKSWPSSANSGYADLEATITFSRTEYVRDANGNVQPKPTIETATRTFQNKEWVSRQTSVSITPESLSRRFHWMTTYWDNIKFYPYERALDWAKNQRTEELRSRNPNLFGIEIKGEHIGYVGPLLTCCFLMYLLSFLIQLHKAFNQDAQLQAASEGLSSWIGMMTNLPALAITWISLIVGPIAAVMLPLWRLLGVHWFWSAVAGLVVGLLGFRCAWISTQLAFRNLLAVQTSQRRG